MQRIWTSQVLHHAGERIRLAGWLHRLRRLSHIAFLLLRDGKGIIQVVIEDESLAERLASLHPETVLEVTGTVVAEPKAKGGAEIHQSDIRVLSPAIAPPPLDLFKPKLTAQLPFLLDHAPVTLRHPRHRALFRLSAATMAGFRRALEGEGFVEIQTPKLVGSATEGGANVFAVDYFGKTAYLAQSPQFYKQMMVGVFERVFEVGPVFRAEPHDTPRHLSEYVSLDVEMGFIQDHFTVMETLTELLREMTAFLRDREEESLVMLEVTLPSIPAEIPTVHFLEAQALYRDGTGVDTTGEPDLDPAQERWLGSWARERYGSDFLFVTGYPMAKRPFYTAPDPERPGYSNSFDLLFRGLELVTGGQRLHRYEEYVSALRGRGLNPDGFESYLETFRHGMPPHGGFAIGLERWVARLVGAANIRETTLFPRDLHRLTP